MAKKQASKPIQAKPESKLIRTKIPPRQLVLFSIGLIILLAIFVLTFNLKYSDKIFPRTLVGGVNLGGMTKLQAEEALNQAIKEASDQKLTLTLKEKKIEVKGETIGVNYDVAASSEMAWKNGREESFVRVFSHQFKSIIGLNNTFAIVFSYDSSKLEKIFTDFDSTLKEPLKETTIVINDLKPSVQVGQPGQAVDDAKIESKIKNFFGFLEKSTEVVVEVKESSPRVSQESAQETLRLVQNILQQNIQLKALDKTFDLKPEDFVVWLEFTPVKNFWTRNWTLSIGFNNDKLTGYVSELAKQIDQEPKNAKFSVNSGKVTAFEVSQEGHKLNQNKTKEEIGKALSENKNIIILPVEIIEPTVASDSVGSKDFKELVGEGKTSWRGSPKNRIHNLTLGSQKISGSVVMPGEEFSTVKTISPITAEAGFLPELVIKNSNMVEPEIGGGLCQVSTTLFRAVLNTGLEVTQRTNHSFRVSYYEPPVGMDATIYDPAPDFKFINNMKTPILIWAVPTDNGLTFQIFGKKDGRLSTVSDPVLYNYVSPPDAVYVVKETMGPDEIRQVERATRGVTASFQYKVVDKDGKVLQDQKFVSKYVPIADTYFVGPGYPIPPPPAE